MTLWLNYRDWLGDIYANVPWCDIEIKHRRTIVTYRLDKPEACPICGRVPVQLFNKSRLFLDDDSDYEWSCRQCYEKKKRQKRPVRYCIQAGDKLKPWSELKRRGKVSRILRDLPKPSACLYCDAVQVELTSRSGTWPEDLNDYVWVCRHHACMIAVLRPEPMPIVIEPLDPDLFQYLYNNTMPGTFEGHSILNKRCAAGRFLAFEPLSLKKYLLS